MGAAGVPALMLFVSGSLDPDQLPPDQRAIVGLQIIGPMGFPLRAPVGARSDPHPARNEAPPETVLAPESVTCVNLVLEQAAQAEREVTLVNVEAPGPRRPLVERWVRPNTLLPLMVRFDGATLSGSEEFTPSNVRRFVRGP
jgi:hypothetical protein